ncbi:MAG: phosphoglyceromutase, partial [Marivirga sp.]|nr:phosphoglyceromutase [Marivirga sp.]
MLFKQSTIRRIFILILLHIILIVAAFGQQKNKTENIILITFDGLRWQEVFNGADSSFMRQQKYLKDDKLKEKFWRDDVNERRKLLLPFFWNTIGTKGQLYGNRATGSKVNVTNNQWFSYPGYNEILTGKADNERINSNDKIYNPNTNVLEFINAQPAFKGKVAAFSSWDVFPFIINDKRSGVYVSTGVKPVSDPKLNEREKMMNDIIMNLPNPLGDVRLDAFTFYYGLEYIKKYKPKVMYFAFDETDDFAH